MKKNLHRIFVVVVTAILLSSFVAIAAPSTQAKAPVVSPQAIAAAKNQLAVQLGVIKLGLGKSAKNLTQAQLQTALAAGTQELNGQGEKVSASILQQATLAALQSPITSQALGLDVTKITPAAIVAAATQINSSIATPALARAAVRASMAFATDNQGISHPLFGLQPDTSSLPPNADKATVEALNNQTKTAQLQNAASAEGEVLTAALQGIDPQIKPGTIAKISPQDPNYSKIVATIAAISSASINGLGNINIGSVLDPLYGKTIPNIKALMISLISTSEGLINLTPPTGANGQPGESPILTAVKQGALEAAPTLNSAIAGIAQGDASSTTTSGNKQQNAGNSGSAGTPGGGAGGVPGLGTFGLGNGGGGSPTPTPAPVTSTTGA